MVGVQVFLHFSGVAGEEVKEILFGGFKEIIVVVRQVEAVIVFIEVIGIGFNFLGNLVVGRIGGGRVGGGGLGIAAIGSFFFPADVFEGLFHHQVFGGIMTDFAGIALIAVVEGIAGDGNVGKGGGVGQGHGVLFIGDKEDLPEHPVVVHFSGYHHIVLKQHFAIGKSGVFVNIIGKIGGFLLAGVNGDSPLFLGGGQPIQAQQQ